jgi:chemotaxis family two-component system response regulator Rcp1
MSSRQPGRPFEILFVEDDRADVELLEEVLRDSEVPHNLHIVSDGEKASAFLRHGEGYMNVPTPDLILLDLNLPKKDGRAVLADIKSDPQLRSIPVLVLTTSTSEDDVLHTYDLLANCYLTKPLRVAEFGRVLRATVEFWLNTAVLPPR